MFLYDPLAGSSLSTIQVSRQHPLGLAGARLAAEAIAQDMSEEYELDCEWEDEEETRLLFRGAGGQRLFVPHRRYPVAGGAPRPDAVAGTQRAGAGDPRIRRSAPALPNPALMGPINTDPAQETIMK